MKVENISAVLRPRPEAEAVDLGFALVRRHAAGIYRAWLTLLLPLWALLIVVLHDHPEVMVIIAWWLKPLYDRVVLFYLGRSLFGAPPTLREQLREWPRLLFRGAGRALLLDRLSGIRSFAMPVTVLEELKGKARKDRIAALARHGSSSAFGFMSMMALLELAVVMGILAAVWQALPEEYVEWMHFAFESMESRIPPPQGLLWAVAGAWLAAVAVIEPFYAGGGFGLYINTRTNLEGWDVDLAFRQLGLRLEARKLNPAPPTPAPAPTPAPVAPTSAGLRPPPLLPLLMLALGMGLLGAWAPPLAAQEVDHEKAKTEIREILAHPDFKEHVKKEREWEPDPSPPTPPSKPDTYDWSWATNIWKAITQIFAGDWKEVALRLLGASLMAGLLIWLGRMLWRHWAGLPARVVKKKRRDAPRTVMGMEVTPESLPPDIPEAAWQSWQEGDAEAAVRVLYRGALVWLMEEGGIPIRASDTEGDCLAHSGALPEVSRRDYFADLTGIWLATAYGRKPPDEREMQELCAKWPFSLSPPASKSPAAPGSPVTAMAALLVLLAPLMLTGCKGKWVDRERELGYLGEARRNPWLAATRFLELNGYPVLTRRGVLELPDPDSVVILPSEAVPSAALARLALDWARQGGHLIYFVEGAGHFQSDWASGSSFLSRDPGSQPLLTLMDVTMHPKNERHPVLRDRIDIDGTEFEVSVQENVRFDVTGFDGDIGFPEDDRNDAVMANLRVGQGQVTLVANARPFRNRWIDDGDHAALLLQLVGQTEYPLQVVIIKTGRVNLWHMLVEHAAPVLLTLGILLAFWLWSVLLRSGPVRALPQRSERRFATHLDEAGAFLWKQKLADALLEAPRESVRTAARLAGLRGDTREFNAMAAKGTGLSLPQIHQALEDGGVTDPKRLVRQMADLQTLLAALKRKRSASSAPSSSSTDTPS